MKLLMVFIYPTNGIRTHGGMGKGGKVIKVPFVVGARMIYCTKQAEKAHRKDLGKKPSKGVLLSMVLDNGEVQHSTCVSEVPH